MTARVGVLIPSYQRPQSVHRVINSLRAATPGEREQWAVYVIAETDDLPTVHAAVEAGAMFTFNRRARSYAGAINTAYKITDEPILFAGADDLAFHPGWLDTALEVFEQDAGAMVVGTNDLCNPYVHQEIHATHYLMRRDYLDEFGGSADGPGLVLHEGYFHNQTDNEAVSIARSRGVFRPCLASIVEHLHVTTGKAPSDPTHEKNYAEGRYGADEALFRTREHLWTPASQ